jgi:hypothetical protein
METAGDLQKVWPDTIGQVNLQRNNAQAVRI